MSCWDEALVELRGCEARWEKEGEEASTHSCTVRRKNARTEVHSHVMDVRSEERSDLPGRTAGGHKSEVTWILFEDTEKYPRPLSCKM